MKYGTLLLIILLAPLAQAKVTLKESRILSTLVVPAARINPFVLFEFSARAPTCLDQKSSCLRQEEARLKNNMDAQLKTVGLQLDQYFNSLIEGYSEPIQKELKRMYYEQEYVFEDALHVENGGDFGVTRGVFYPDRIELKIHLDRKIARTEIFSKIVLIHEIGVHAGQTSDLLKNSGAANFHELMRSPSFRAFTELSAALVMKRIFDSISPEVLEYDVHKNVSSHIVREAIFRHVQWVRNSEWKTSAWLLGKRTLEKRYSDQKMDFDFVKNLTDRFEAQEKPGQPTKE